MSQKDKVSEVSVPDPLNKGILSLTHMARLKCIKNAHLINDIGSAPYHLIEPILLKKTAKSLKQVESNSPHIISDTEPLWKSLLKRDFPNRPDNQKSLNSKNSNIKSRVLYDKYVNEMEVRRKNAALNLKQINKDLTDMKRKNQVKSISFLPPSNKKPKTFNTQPSKQIFKSNLLQKARVVNKQRVRHFQNTSHNPIPSPTPLNFVKLGRSSSNSSTISSSPNPLRRIPSPSRPKTQIPSRYRLNPSKK